jgi:hypothetical protein
MIIGVDVSESSKAHVYGYQVFDDYENVFFWIFLFPTP